MPTWRSDSSASTFLTVNLDYQWHNQNTVCMRVNWLAELGPYTWSGTSSNRTMKVYKSDGTLLGSAVIKNGVGWYEDHDYSGSFDITFNVGTYYDGTWSIYISVTGDGAQSCVWTKDGYVTNFNMSWGLYYTDCTPPAYLYIGSTPGATGLVTSEGNQVLRWTAGGAGIGNPVTGYRIYRREYDSAGTAIAGWVLRGDVVNLSLEVSPPSTRSNYYMFYIITLAANSSYNSDIKYSTNGLRKQPITACGAPTALQVNDTLSDSAVILSWSGASAGYGNSITRYKIERAESTDGSTWDAWSHLTYVNTSSTSGSLSVSPPATNGNYYNYRARTEGSAGSGYYSGYKVSTNTLRRTPYSAVGMPSSVSLVKTCVEVNTTLNWTQGADGHDNPVIGYNVMYSDDNGQNWSLYSYVAGKTTLNKTVVPYTARGSIRMFGVISKATISGLDSGRRNSSNTLTKNRLPNQIISAITASKSVVVAGESFTLNFYNSGDSDGNDTGVEVAMKDMLGVWYGAPTIVASRTVKGTTYVVVDTTGWTNGKTWDFYVRIKDSENTVGAWSKNSVTVTVGAVCNTNDEGTITQCLIVTNDNGTIKYLIPYTNDDGTIKQLT